DHFIRACPRDPRLSYRVICVIRGMAWSPSRLCVMHFSGKKLRATIGVYLCPSVADSFRVVLFASFESFVVLLFGCGLVAPANRPRSQSGLPGIRAGAA